MHSSKSSDLPRNNPHNDNHDDYYYYFNGKRTLKNSSNNQPAIDEILTLYQEQSPSSPRRSKKKVRRRDLDLPLPPLPSEVKKTSKHDKEIFPQILYFGSSVERKPSLTKKLPRNSRSPIPNTYQSPIKSSLYYNKRRDSGVKHHYQRHREPVGISVKSHHRRSIKPLNLQLFPIKSSTAAVHPVVRHLPERRTAKVVRLNSHRSLVMPQVGTLDASRYRFLTDDVESTTSSTSSSSLKAVNPISPETPRLTGAPKVSHRKALFHSSVEKDLALQKDLPPLPSKITDRSDGILTAEKTSILPRTPVSIKLVDNNSPSPFPSSPHQIGNYPTTPITPLTLTSNHSLLPPPKVSTPASSTTQLAVNSKPPPPLPKDEPKKPKPSTISSPKRRVSEESNRSFHLNGSSRPISISSDIPEDVVLHNSEYIYSQQRPERDSSSIFKSQFTTLPEAHITQPLKVRKSSSLKTEAIPPSDSPDEELSSLLKGMRNSNLFKDEGDDILLKDTVGKTSTAPNENSYTPQQSSASLKNSFLKSICTSTTTIDDDENFVSACSETPQTIDTTGSSQSLDGYFHTPQTPYNEEMPGSPPKNASPNKSNRLASPIPLSPSSLIQKPHETPRTSISSDSLLRESNNQNKASRVQSTLSSSSSIASTDLINEIILDHQTRKRSLSSRLSPIVTTTPRSDSLPGSNYVNRLRTSASIHEQITPTEGVMPSSDADQARLRKKFNLIRELVDTEEVFATDMGVLVDIYYRKLRSEQFFGYICKTDMMRLFSNVDQILLLSRQCVMTLRDSINPYVFDSKVELNDKSLSDVETRVGSAILNFIPLIESTFQTYCDSNKWQMDTFYRLRSLACPNIDLWLSECLEVSKSITTAWTLDALLIKPVQRLLKYPLLLDSMLKGTSEDHPDYPHLKLASELMRKCVDRINSDHPPDFGPTSDENSSQRSSSGSRRRSAEDEAASLRQLKTNPTADGGLQDLLAEFNQKRRNIRFLIQAIAANSTDIQHQFNSNSVLAKAWLTWSMAIGMDEDDSAKMRRYKHYALFSTPFTSTSSTQLSTARLSRKIEREVLVPLEKVWAMYERTELLAADRLRFHASYAKYVASKTDLSYASTTGNSSEHSSFSATDRQRADLFFKYHNSLKDGLPDLFRLTDRMVECCFGKFIEIQRQWFRMAVDSMATVFNLKVDDIQDADGRLDHDPVVDKFRKAESNRESVLDLGICRESFIGDDSAVSGTSTSDSDVNNEASERMSLTPILSSLTTASSKDRLNIRRKSSLLSLTNWQRTMKNTPSKFLGV